MHEISLVSSIWKTLDATLSESELNALKLIRLKVGALANVEPILLDSAFQAITKNTRFDGVELRCTLIPATAHCESCKDIFPVNNYRFICPTCDQPTSDVRSGEEFLIENVEFSTEGEELNSNHKPNKSCAPIPNQ
ncbi:MAG: hydrogenase maturation nickel metallochaperone HypA [Verrucomicrobiales bacterium]|nr:hydrogenase maturation nickel metallochaperone HypA [Verrucomicrobiales bacterium]